MKKKISKTSTTSAILTPESPFIYSEAYRSMRANLRYVAATCEKLKRIVITSSLPDEGKSVLAINLAATLAEYGSRVLLIDADLRNPSLHHMMRVKIDRRNGLSAILSGDMKLEDCVFLHPQLKFYFMMSGDIPPNANVMVGSHNMEVLLDSLEESFDYIIIDTPPIGLVSDAAVLSPLTDGVLFVVKQGSTKRGTVRSAIEKLESVNANIIGTVLNMCNIKDYNSKLNYRRHGYYDYNYSYGQKPSK